MDGDYGVVSDARAEELLKKLGIKYEREPEWIKEGRKPDFYCSEPTGFWCEVKTLERSEDSKQLHDALAELNSRTSELPLTGMGIAYVAKPLSKRDAKVVVQLLKRGLRRFGDPDAPDKAVALIPSDPDRTKFVRFSILNRDRQKVEFHSCISTTGRYGTPDGMVPEPDSQIIQLRFSSGETEDLSADGVMERADDFRVAIVVHPNDQPFEIVTAISTGAARRLNNVERIREAVSDANNQLKNAIAYKAAPCLSMIFHDGLDVPDEAIIGSALYGNLKYAFSKEQPENGKLILDRDGAWNWTKNRTTSAVMYVRNNGEPLIIHNYWADRPLPAGLFSCREIAVVLNGQNGTFRATDFSPKTE
jgi:hypothetical protein